MLAPGFTFRGQFEVCRRIGAGGMGVVYEALCLRTERKVALKVLQPLLLDDHDARERFRQEGVVLARVVSEHLVPVLDCGVDAQTGCPYLVMELLQGECLATRMKRGPLLLGDFLEIMGQLSRALSAVHKHGIVHRDLKPQNLYLTNFDDGRLRLRLLDFGIAKVLGKDAAHTTLALGTPSYMAPEQIRGDRNLGIGVDLYAFAHLAFSLLTGTSYFELLCSTPGKRHELPSRILLGPITPASHLAARAGRNVPKGFDLWFRKAANREPRGRFRSAGEAFSTLRTIVEGEPGRRKNRAPALIAWAVAMAALVPFSDEMKGRGDPSLSSVNRAQAHAFPADVLGKSPGVEHSPSPNQGLVVLTPESPVTKKRDERKALKVTDHEHTIPRTCRSDYGRTVDGLKRYDPTCLVQARRAHGMASSMRCSPPFSIGIDGVKRFRPGCVGSRGDD